MIEHTDPDGEARDEPDRPATGRGQARRGVAALSGAVARRSSVHATTAASANPNAFRVPWIAAIVPTLSQAAPMSVWVA